MFIHRTLTSAILQGAKEIPVIAIVGARQSGKSTLAREIFKEYRYFDMQDADLFSFAKNDPKGFLKNYSHEVGIIIDEAQYVPELFAQIKVEVDKNPRPGYFILTGSQNFLLHEKINESLAGRVYQYTLLPLSIAELKEANLLPQTAEALVFKGFYPRVYQENIDINRYYENYLATYVERDIRTIRNIDNILLFKKFLQLCALRIGSPINLASLATDCGITVTTAKHWLALLQTSFIIFELPPYHQNLGKRIIKSPKLFFYDVGLAAKLMQINQETILQQREFYGALFENMVIIDLLKNSHALPQKPTFSFFKNSNHNEIDLIIEQGITTIPLEIKASLSIKPEFFKTSSWFASEKKESRKPIIVYGGNEKQEWSYGTVLPWNQLDVVLK